MATRYMQAGGTDGTDGTFKMLQLTDIHWQDGGEADQRTRKLIAELLDAEQPDLAVLTGDIIYSSLCPDPRKALLEAVEPLEERGIRWAAVFGNHDTEAGISREALMDTIMSCPHAIAEPGPADVAGVGNYAVAITGATGRAEAALYFLDSGSYASHRAGGYAALDRSQIAWYEQQSLALEQEHGRLIPALAFFHIPLPEYEEVWRTQQCYGNKLEQVCAPLLNTGMFAAMVARGDVMGMFVGHDHLNDYWGELHGIKLHYGRGTSRNTYGFDDAPRGARAIELRAGEPGFRTWLRLEGGEVIREQPGHVPNG